MTVYFGIVGGREYRIEVRSGEQFLIDGQERGVGMRSLGNGRYSAIVNDRSISISVSGSGIERSYMVNGKPLTVVIESDRTRLLKQLKAGAGDEQETREVRAPMPALVSSLLVEVGEVVTTGQGLLILEAMKMENEIKSHCRGVVDRILVAKGKPVEKGELLVVLGRLEQ